MENETYEETFENDSLDGNEEELYDTETENTETGEEELESVDSSEGYEDLGEVSLGDILAELSIMDGRLESWETVENIPIMQRNVSELNYEEGTMFILVLGVLFAVLYFLLSGKGVN